MLAAGSSEKKIRQQEGEMKMLTWTESDGSWGAQGVDLTKVDRTLYGALCKLRDYEKTGLEPGQVEQMDVLYLEKCEEVNRMKKQLGGKAP